MSAEEEKYSKKNTTMGCVHLPEELMILILEKLPPSSSIRFKTLCKSLHRIISAQEFLQRRISLLSKAHEKSLTIVEMIDNSYAVLESPTSSASTKFAPLPLPNFMSTHVVVGSCKGIVCLAEFRTAMCFFWNPTTVEWRTLPYHHQPDHHLEGSYKYSFGFDEYDGDLKVVKISSVQIESVEQLLHYRYRASIYESSLDSWREISPIGIDTRKLIYDCGARRSRAWSTGGRSCSWMACRWDIATNVSAHCSIVSFDMATEAFTTFSSPTDIQNIDNEYVVASLRLLTLNGFLALSCRRPADEKSVTGSIQIWVLLQPGVAESWTKLWTIRLPPLESHWPLAFWNGGLVIQSRGVINKRLMWCDLSNRRGTIQALPIASMPSQKIFTVVAFERTHASLAAILLSSGKKG